jgi:hypothetical protein
MSQLVFQITHHLPVDPPNYTSPPSTTSKLRITSQYVLQTTHHLAVGSTNYTASSPSRFSKRHFASQQVLQTMQHCLPSMSWKLCSITSLYVLQTMQHHLPENLHCLYSLVWAPHTHVAKDEMVFDVLSILCHNCLCVGEQIAMSAVSDL